MATLLVRQLGTVLAPEAVLLVVDGVVPAVLAKGIVQTLWYSWRMRKRSLQAKQQQ